MEGKVFSVQGKELRSIELSDDVFGLPVNEDVIWYAINNELANARVGTADTKTRSDVHGSNRRPYAQKGTGRARQGDVKSPIYVGGGTVFGPHPRDYSYSINKKAKRLAMKSILSLKAQNSAMKVVEDFSVESGKTKDLASILSGLVPEGKAERTVVILKDDDSMVKRAGRNIPWLHFLSFNRLRAHDLFYGRTVIVMESAVKSLNEFYADK
ncbi:MAG TPA: 50S ribosomal protein L4 [Spirochaetia bacterium]|nr:50S ribosomal protein L4 [Spirochaetaceae bacterium]HPE88888.1 50S ribosomal protein L4 [Spirochaetales bacterium]HRW23684.1 50S ribosomal protein L4 [Spirochaetia bacterium]